MRVQSFFAPCSIHRAIVERCASREERIFARHAIAAAALAAVEGAKVLVELLQEEAPRSVARDDERLTHVLCRYLADERFVDSVRRAAADRHAVSGGRRAVTRDERTRLLEDRYDVGAKSDHGRREIANLGGVVAAGAGIAPRGTRLTATTERDHYEDRAGGSTSWRAHEGGPRRYDQARFSRRERTKASPRTTSALPRRPPEATFALLAEHELAVEDAPEPDSAWLRGACPTCSQPSNTGRAAR